MAHSPGSAERRAHLIREMARRSDGSRGCNSVASSVASGSASIHDIDTESQQLPALPYVSNNAPGLEPDFQVNTSALRRAFPGFSQYGSSEEDSIEFGRGSKMNTQRQLNRTLLSEDVSENIQFSFDNGDQYQVLGTPPIRSRRTPTAVTTEQSDLRKAASRVRGPSQKENVDSLTKTMDYVSGSSSKGSRDGRRSLAELHARVDSDESILISDRRPLAVNLTAKNTRFSNNRSKNGPSGDVVTQLSGDLVAKASNPNQVLNNGTVTSIQSIGNNTILPDLPSNTYLLSGLPLEGTPLLSRSTKSRSRFAIPSQSLRGKSGKPAHPLITSVTVPADEKALFLSLQMLQTKVGVLEEEKATSEQKADDYELEVLELKSKLEEQETFRQYDTGRGTDTENVKNMEWGSEKEKLDILVRSLQARLDRANRKVSLSEVKIQNLSKTQEAARQDQAVAYLTSTEVINESQALRDEIDHIKAQLTKVTRAHERKIAKLTQQETELRQKIERREKAIREMSSLAKQIWDTRHVPRISNNSNKSAIAKDDSATNSGNVDPLQHNTRRSSRTQSGQKSSQSAAATRTRSLASTKTPPGLSRGSQSRHISKSDPPALDHVDAECYDMESTTEIDGGKRGDSSQVARELTRDSTFLSFMEGDEVAKLRRILDEDRARLRKSFSNPGDHQQAESKSYPSIAVTNNMSCLLPRKSSLKGITANSKKQQVQYEEDENTDRLSIEPGLNNDHDNIRDQVVRDDNPLTTETVLGKQDTQRSIASHRSEQRRRSGTNLPTEITSAFILPDIILIGATFASRNFETDPAEDRKTTAIPRPRPVSDSMPCPCTDNEDLTMRPAQPPGVALAVVLKGFEDELVQLKAQLSQQEALYRKHDPALGKRKRQAVFARMQVLLATIEVRSDQIYALYDVLEGQKESGMLMREEDVEITLQNILGAGISSNINRKSEEATKVVKCIVVDGEADKGSSDNDSQGGNEDAEQLPWGGIEPTQTLDGAKGFGAAVVR